MAKDPIRNSNLTVNSLYDTVWLTTIQPRVPAFLQWSGPASVDGGNLTTRGGGAET
jgi:hypothetical protein